MRRAPSPPVTEYLLDTVLIRSLKVGEEHELLTSVQHCRLSTSYIAPLEMLWALPRIGAEGYQRQYRLRRAGLSKYDRLIGFSQTYWSDEQGVIAGAFGATQPSTDKRWLQWLIRTCIACHSLEEFENAIEVFRADGGRVPSLDELRQDREAKSRTYRASLQNAADKMRNSPVDFPPGSTLAFVIADWARRHVLKESLTNRYDGSLDFYAQVYVAYANEIATGRKAPGSKTDNDPYDIAQLCYLRSNDPNQYFVTDDQALLLVGKKVAPTRLIDKPTFLAHIA